MFTRVEILLANPVKLYCWIRQNENVSKIVNISNFGVVDKVVNISHRNNFAEDSMDLTSRWVRHQTHA